MPKSQRDQFAQLKKKNREDKKIIRFLELCDNGYLNEDDVGCKMAWRKKVWMGADGWRHGGKATPGKGKVLAIYFFYEWEDLWKE